MVISITNCGTGGGVTIYGVVWDAGSGGYVYQDFDYCWNGHTFDPPEPWWECTCYPGSWWYDPPSIFDASNAFNASTLKPGNELVAGAACFSGFVNGNVVGVKYSDNGGLICQCTHTIQPSEVGDWYAMWYALGIRYGEFDNNSNFCFHAFATGVACVNYGFTISNIDDSSLIEYPGKQGYTWVSGENIWFIDAGCHNKHCIKHDGSTYGSAGADKCGYIWVPDSANVRYLNYVNENGDIRRTHNGDICGYRDCDGQPSSGHPNGYIWAEEGFNDHALMFINYSGKQVRISNGFRDANCY